MSDKSAENLRRIRAWDAWEESDHPRADNGQFTSGGGGSAAPKAPAANSKKIANAKSLLKTLKFHYDHTAKAFGKERAERDFGAKIKSAEAKIAYLQDPDNNPKPKKAAAKKGPVGNAKPQPVPAKASSKVGAPGSAVDVSKFKFTNYRNPDGQNHPGYETYRSAMESAAREIEKQAERVLTSYWGETPPAEQYDTERDHIFRHSSFRDIVSPSSDPGLKECEKALHKRAQVLYEHLKQFTKWDASQRRWVKEGRHGR